MIDAHCHLDSKGILLNLLIQEKIPATINCQNENEWYHHSIAIKDHSFLDLSAGIHPWDSDFLDIDTFFPMLNKTEIIGEIGMDNTWTTIPLEIQEQVFVQQLEIAYKLRKPVILHTKGQELEIAEIIQDYPNSYLVHWYSSDSHLDRYIALDCYFTIGPSIINDPVIQNIATKVPLDRLLFESDGLSALSWAHQLEEDKLDYVTIQEKNLQFLANLKKITYLELKYTLRVNYERWLQCRRENM
ncbi:MULTISPECIES: TatD family hydrolase [Vagococcus]|uniref:Putative deoxyribonuclease YcfH n=1 Tax=Vagococcus fluvialis bH819 TaxID=1255619 RepID=A0A1X6WNU0_9ENTE|nr:MULTISPECIES: TatD family hydrolase [Vagococcus]SLM85940.1 Putative deoxyribonuclease YcfH [Vagococcus fluvialis bH819]HCM88307.1 hydrolase TatD [Vagococcus sp.]